MDNNKEALILLAALIIITIAAAVVKAVEFFTEFNREIRYFKMEMKRAENNLEYRYWRRELRCRRLRLIPFVGEKNVSLIYRLIYHGGRKR